MSCRIMQIYLKDNNACLKHLLAHYMGIIVFGYKCLVLPYFKFYRLLLWGNKISETSQEMSQLIINLQNSSLFVGNLIAILREEMIGT